MSSLTDSASSGTVRRSPRLTAIDRARAAARVTPPGQTIFTDPRTERAARRNRSRDFAAADDISEEEVDFLEEKQEAQGTGHPVGSGHADGFGVGVHGLGLAYNKKRRYLDDVRLATGMLSGITALPQTPTPAEERRYVKDFESAAGFSDRDAGFVENKEFHTLFLRGLGSGACRVRHDAIMQRPHIKRHWDAAETQEHAFMRDLKVDSAPGTRPPPRGNYAAGFWQAHKVDFLGMERVPWHVAHHKRFARKGHEQGKLTVSQYYEREFMQLVQSEHAAQDWPVDDADWGAFCGRPRLLRQLGH